MVFNTSASISRLPGLLGRFCLVTGASLALAVAPCRAALVEWGLTLDPGLLAKSGSVTYSNVNGEGYDIVVTTLGLNAEGAGNFGIAGGAATSWWFEGQKNSLGSSVAFRFFETGTTNPTGVTGVHFQFEDSEVGEQFANFGYWNPAGIFQLTPHNSGIFAGSSPGLATGLPANYLQNNAPYAGGTQPGKSLDVDFSAIPISGFSFSPLRASSAAGSVEMTGLGNVQRIDVAIPEPTTALFGLAILGALSTARRRALRGKSCEHVSE